MDMISCPTLALRDDPENQKSLNTQQVCSPDNQADYILNQVTSEQCVAPALGGSAQTTGDLSLELKNSNTTEETQQTPDGATIQTVMAAVKVFLTKVLLQHQPYLDLLRPAHPHRWCQ